MKPSLSSPSSPLSLRSYGADGALHRHAHVQIVLPLQGRMEIEVGGRGQLLDLSRAAFVAPDVDHVQSAAGPNRFLILDCQHDALDDSAIERLQRQTFVQVNPALRHLLEFIDLRCQSGMLPDLVAQHCAPMLLDALLASADSASPSRQAARLAQLLLHMQAAPEQDWSVTRMAEAMHVSVSRLHALFRAELQQTPQEWLSAMRLRLVQEALAGSDLPLAELALRNGYASQSTLTRAMRRATGMTPAVYRRQRRQ